MTRHCQVSSGGKTAPLRTTDSKDYHENLGCGVFNAQSSVWNVEWTQQVLGSFFLSLVSCLWFLLLLWFIAREDSCLPHWGSWIRNSQGQCSSNNPLMLWPWAISRVTWASSTEKWETWTWWLKCPFWDDTSWSLEDAGQDWKKEGCQEYFMRKNAKSWLCEIKQNDVGGGGC